MYAIVLLYVHLLVSVCGWCCRVFLFFFIFFFFHANAFRGQIEHGRCFHYADCKNWLGWMHYPHLPVRIHQTQKKQCHTISWSPKQTENEKANTAKYDTKMQKGVKQKKKRKKRTSPTQTNRHDTTQYEYCSVCVLYALVALVSRAKTFADNFILLLLLILPCNYDNIIKLLLMVNR